MDPPFSCTPVTLAAIERTLSPLRLGRYLPAAGSDPNMALRLYIWNMRLCEAFYLPCQIAEVACRNAVARALLARYGPQWYSDRHFRSILPARLREELNKVAGHEYARRGAGMVGDHVLSGLTFGFWVHLLTSGFDFALWQDGMGASFPGAPNTTGRADIHARVDRIRVFRNRVAHHGAVFDKKPTAENNNIVIMVGWICTETQWLLAQLSRVPRTINLRPRE